MSAPVTHVDADALAEFRAGLITGRRGAKIAAHLASCDRCAALDGQLAGVSALLAAIPAPVVPGHVALRLDTVLAAEVASRNDPERARREPSPQTGVSARRTGSRRFRLPSPRVLTPVAAAAAVVLAAGGYGLSLLASGPGNQFAASSAGSAAKAAASPKGAASRAAAAVPSPLPVSGSHRMSLAGFAVVTSPADFQPAGLGQQVAAAITAAPAASLAQRTSPQLRACVQKVADGDGVIKVIIARYQGHPATIVVVRTGPGDEARVAGPDCSGTNPDVLNHTSLPSGI